MRSEVQIFPGPPTFAREGAPIEFAAATGAIAQLGERLLCKQEVVGSIPSGSTNSFDPLLLPRVEFSRGGLCRLLGFFYIVKRGLT